MTVLILVPARSSFINDFKTVTLDFVKNIEAKKKKKKIQAPSNPVCKNLFEIDEKYLLLYLKKKKIFLYSRKPSSSLS